jgi:short-subunit dehydrogenase
MRTVLITGASDGIGKSIATKLAHQKYNLVLLGRDQGKLGVVKQVCEAKGAVVQVHAFDLNDNIKRQEIVSQILASQQVDVLINNAGIWHKVGDVTTLDEEEIEQVVSLNLTSQILLTRQLLNHMRERTGTAIINIISKSGIVTQAGQSVYAASKFGMKGFTDVLRIDTKDEPIRIAGVYQAGTATDMFTKAGDDFPVEKFTNPDDLADVIVFMLTRPDKIWLNEVHIAY